MNPPQPSLAAVPALPDRPRAPAREHRPPAATAAPAATSDRVDVEIVIPTYNEERSLAASVYRLHGYLSRSFPFTWRIVVADNASTDCTPEIAAALSRELPGVTLLRLEAKGRGRALRAAWSTGRAQVVCYMDVDLSTDLKALLPLVAPLLSGHSDVAIGSRLARGARVTRGPKREFISRGYNHLLRAVLGAHFSDAQCGFKAVRADVAATLLPLVRDNAWFFDTELLVLAQRHGLRIHEVPVDWVDDPDSRVDIVSTAWADLRGVARLRLATPLTRFLLIGVVSTLAYAAVFLALAGPLGSRAASATGLALTAVANTAANRRFTFGIRGREGLLRQHAGGAVVFLLALGLTDGALTTLHRLDPQPPRIVELLVLVSATLLATVSRYVALRAWVFARHRAPGSEPGQDGRSGPTPAPRLRLSGRG